MSSGSTSRSLLDDARRADPAAWHRLVSLYAPLVASWCRRWGVLEQDVVDLVQEVFSAVAGNLGRFSKRQPNETFRGWLATITHNKVRDHFRKRAREPEATGGTEAWMRLQQIKDADARNENQLSNESGSVIDRGFSAVLLRALESIRSEFHENTWKAFWGVVIEGRAAADVAADLSMRAGTVRVAKSRVLLRLRRELGDLESFGDAT